MTRLATAVLVAALSVAGCGGESSGPGGVDRSKSISTTSEAEKGNLCDWYVAKVGGYGAPKMCAAGPLGAPPTKADCLSKFPSCTATVAQFEACIETIVAAQTICTEQSLAGVTADPSCQAVYAAGCFGNGS